MQAPNKAKIGTGQAAKPLNASMRWLVGVSLLCLALVFGLRGYFDHLESGIRLRGENERARLFIGEEIVSSIREVEKDFYRLAVTQNQGGFARVHAAIERRLDKVEHDLGVLQKGGISQRQIKLNIDGTDAATREARYQPDIGDGSLVMELIDAEFSNLAGPPSLDSCTRDVYSADTCFELPVALRIAQSIVAVAQHLHQQGIMHGDLYGHNILHCGEGRTLLGDFGAASFYATDDRALADGYKN